MILQQLLFGRIEDLGGNSICFPQLAQSEFLLGRRARGSHLAIVSIWEPVGQCQTMAAISFSGYHVCPRGGGGPRARKVWGEAEAQSIWLSFYFQFIWLSFREIQSLTFSLWYNGIIGKDIGCDLLARKKPQLCQPVQKSLSMHIGTVLQFLACLVFQNIISCLEVILRNPLLLRNIVCNSFKNSVQTTLNKFGRNYIWVKAESFWLYIYSLL